MTLDNESDIKEKEIEAIEELRKRIKGDIEQELFDDKYFFLRFLRARDLNVNDAEAMLRKHLTWREKYDVKNIFEFERPEVMKKHFSNVMIGYDKTGSVIRYCPAGSLDFIGIFASSTFDEWIKTFTQDVESDILELKKKSIQLGRNLDKTLYIYDHENLSFATVTDKKVLSYLYCMIKTYMENYPERLKAAYIINASVYFHLLFSVLKPLLPKTVLDKVFIYSDDSYKEDLLKIVDADVLPAFLGGNKTDPDGNHRCHTLINPIEPVPKSLYLQKGKRTLSKVPGVKKIILSSAAFHEEKLEVEEPGSFLEWEFETKSRDIGFGLFYNQIIEKEETITELVPIQRIDTDYYPETGTFRCEKPGIYVIVFDNTYSWIRTKEIYFRAKVVTPEEYEAENK